MSMTDDIEWGNLKHKGPLTDVQSESFTDTQMNYITDTGSSSTQIVWDNLPNVGTPYIPAETFLSIPVLFCSSNPLIPYTPGKTALAPKMGYLSMVQTVQYATASGEQILNEATTPWFINQLRPKFELTDDATRSIAMEGCLQPDFFPRYISPVATGPGVFNGASATGSLFRPTFASQFAGNATTILGGGGTNYPPYYDGNTSTLNYLQSDVFNQPNEFRFGFGLSSISIAVAGAGLALGTTVSGTFSIQVNPKTFAPPAIGAGVSSIKYLFGAPTTTSAFSLTNPVSDAPVVTLLNSGNNIPGNNSNSIYDGDWPVIAITFLNGVATGARISHPGSGLMFMPAGVNTTCPNVVPITIIAGGLTLDGRFIAAATPLQINVTIGAVTASSTSAGSVASDCLDAAYGFGNQSPLTNQPLVSPNPLWNKGFDDRIRSFWNNTIKVAAGNGVTTSDVYLTWFIIRLKDLHDHFKQLYYPQVNLRTLLTLQFAAPINPSSQLYGMMLGPGAAMMAPPIMAIGNTAVNNFPAFSAGQSRMYMKTVRFDGEQSQTYRLMLEKGLSKTVVHLETEMYPLALQSTSNNINVTITTATVNAQRVWIFGIPSGAPLLNVGLYANSSLAALQGQSANTVSQPFCGFTPTMRASQVILNVNQKPWRDVSFQYDFEYWKFLAQELRGSGESWSDGSLINYDDFANKGLSIFYPFNLNRAGKRLNKNEPIQLGINITRPSDTNFILSTGACAPVDIYCLIEKTAQVDYHINDGNSRIVKTF